MERLYCDMIIEHNTSVIHSYNRFILTYVHKMLFIGMLHKICNRHRIVRITHI